MICWCVLVNTKLFSLVYHNGLLLSNAHSTYNEASSKPWRIPVVAIIIWPRSEMVVVSMDQNVEQLFYGTNSN